LANKGEDQGTSESIDDHFNKTECPNRLDVILWGVHFIHEGELADGEGVGEDDVGDGDEAVRESDVLFGPCGPVYGFETAGRTTVYYGGGDDGDADGEHDGYEVDVAEDGHFGERGGKGE